MAAHLPWMLTALGLTYLLSESSVFMPVRLWLSVRLGTYGETLAFCPACVGFWMGVLTLGLGHFGLVPLPDIEMLWLPVGSCFLGALYGNYRGPHPTYTFESTLIDAQREARKAKK